LNAVAIGSSKKRTSALEAHAERKEKRARHKRSVTGSMDGINETMISLTEILKKDNPPPPWLTSRPPPYQVQTQVQGASATADQQHRQAVKMIEEDEEIISDDECATAVAAVTKNPEWITTYLSFTRKGVRRAWLARLLSEDAEE
jgi:threonine synthase